ncbi:uncharacterized protein LOC132615801 [Lycium barbarum]|uniref:uncharacterized protein LOC132615801 n=1 Tax=Lycium barbarum TaxID=112863 RepID=UPI00293F4D9E|nr:uncharacterized protein LOC132615801 [Lycium barbarum]
MFFSSAVQKQYLEKYGLNEMAGEKRGKKIKKAKETGVPQRPPQNLVIRDRSPLPRLPPRGAPLPHDPLMKLASRGIPSYPDDARNPHTQSSCADDDGTHVSNTQRHV